MSSTKSLALATLFKTSSQRKVYYSDLVKNDVLPETISKQMDFSVEGINDQFDIFPKSSSGSRL